MAKYFALVNDENIVEQVIVSEEEFVDGLAPEDGKQWIETFAAGEGGKRYASPGYIYDPIIEDFLSPKPYPSWSQDGNRWVPPSPKPEGDSWRWNEDEENWEEIL